MQKLQDIPEEQRSESEGFGTVVSAGWGQGVQGQPTLRRRDQRGRRDNACVGERREYVC